LVAVGSFLLVLFASSVAPAEKMLASVERAAAGPAGASPDGGAPLRQPGDAIAVLLDRTFDDEAAAGEALRALRGKFAEQAALRMPRDNPDLGRVDRLGNVVATPGAAGGKWVVMLGYCTADGAEELTSGAKWLGPLRKAGARSDRNSELCPVPRAVTVKQSVAMKLGDGTTLEARVFGTPRDDLPAVSAVLRGDQRTVIESVVIMEHTFSEFVTYPDGCKATVKRRTDEIEVRYACRGAMDGHEGCYHSPYKAMFVVRIGAGHLVADLTSHVLGKHAECGE
jgi:hypothetical protein